IQRQALTCGRIKPRDSRPHPRCRALHDLEVALTGELLELVTIDDFDSATVRSDAAALLECMGRHGDGGALHAQEMGAASLRDVEDRAVERVARLQEPAAEPPFDRMQSVALSILL